MNEILGFGFGMPPFQAALLDCLRAGRFSLFDSAIIEEQESSELAFALEVSTWKTLA